MLGYLMTLRKGLLLIPLFAMIGLGVTSLTLARQRTVYATAAILEGPQWNCILVSPVGYMGAPDSCKTEPRQETVSNVIRVAVSPEMALETCQKLGQPMAVVTACVVRTSADIQRWSGLIRLSAEGYTPQLVTDYVNTWASVLSSRLTVPAKGDRVTVVEQAFCPTEPISPLWAEALFIAGAASAGLGLASACLVAFFRRGLGQARGPAGP